MNIQNARNTTAKMRITKPVLEKNSPVNILDEILDRLLHFEIVENLRYRLRRVAIIPIIPGIRQSGLGAFLMQARIIMLIHMKEKT